MEYKRSIKIMSRDDVKKVLTRTYNDLATGKEKNISKIKAIIYLCNTLLTAFKHDDEWKQFKEQMEMDKKIYEYERKLMEIEEYLRERGL
ncbi:hypothetical protein BLL41_21395 [Bacillus sp. FMQ74]|uniref:hypothetical protein n=1 Tax=Bacillus sp. FMQ74 TaxID=1913579 RepID=UPI0008FB4B8C|nr:hypothetical protein [Bacillus sp. FMQ74]OIR59265.1 hypothetical protein BLL41_21395 [Bacillus sp. FMQ74]